jgi:hypothetical protein
MVIPMVIPMVILTTGVVGPAVFRAADCRGQAHRQLAAGSQQLLWKTNLARPHQARHCWRYNLWCFPLDRHNNRE